MKQIFTYEDEQIYLTMIEDPEIPEKKLTVGWERAEFEAITGIVFPDNVSKVAIEPNRNIYAISVGDEKAAIYKSPEGDPLVNKISDSLNVIRKHGHAKRLEDIDSEFSQFDYNPDTDMIEKTNDPQKDHKISSRKLGDMNIKVYKLVYKMFKDDASLDDESKNTIKEMKNHINKINW